MGLRSEIPAHANRSFCTLPKGTPPMPPPEWTEKNGRATRKGEGEPREGNEGRMVVYGEVFGEFYGAMMPRFEDGV